MLLPLLWTNLRPFSRRSISYRPWIGPIPACTISLKMCVTVPPRHSRWYGRRIPSARDTTNRLSCIHGYAPGTCSNHVAGCGRWHSSQANRCTRGAPGVSVPCTATYGTAATGHRGRAILPGPQRACCRHALQPRRTGGVGCHACQCGSALSGRLRQVPRRDGRQVAALNERRVRSAGARRAVLAAAHGGLGSAPRVAPAAQ